ncbi:hypothetical protein YC2023_097678 [Brassica napus]
MNKKPGYGAQLCSNLEPTKGVGRLRQQDCCRHRGGNPQIDRWFADWSILDMI